MSSIKIMEHGTKSVAKTAQALVTTYFHVLFCCWWSSDLNFMSHVCDTSLEPGRGYSRLQPPRDVGLNVGALCYTIRRASACTRKRGAARRRAWLEFRAQRHAAKPSDKLWLLDRLSDDVLQSSSAFGKDARLYFETSACSSGRNREIFPMQRISGGCLRPAGMESWRWIMLRRFSNIGLAGLHHLYAYNLRKGLPTSTTAAQRDVQQRLVTRSHDFLLRLERANVEEVVRHLPAWYTDPQASVRETRTNLVPEQIDSLETSGKVDPSRWLPPGINDLLSQPNVFFDGAALRIDRLRPFSAGSRADYARHVANQARSGKVQLATTIKGGGDVFAVGKSGGRQREVWHGRSVSLSAAKPPNPQTSPIRQRWRVYSWDVTNNSVCQNAMRGVL